MIHRLLTVNLLRTLTILFLLSMICSPIHANAQDTLAGYWHLDEGAGSVAADASSHHNTGTLSGSTAWTSQGKAGAALSLAGAGSVDIPTAVVDTSRSFTVAAWVKVRQSGGYQTFVSIDGETISGFFLQLRGDTNAFAFTVPASNNTPQGAMASASSPPEIGTWYYLLGVHDAAAKTISLYVDGVLQQTVPFASPWKAEGHTEIGRAKYNGKPVDFAKADIDEVSLYSGVHLDKNELDKIAKDTHAAESVLTIDTAHATRRISPMLYGLMIEDINHSIDGGLYAELIQNRVFKDDPKTPVHWSVVPGNGAGTIALDATQPISATALNTCLRLDITSNSNSKENVQGVGIANDGYWGIPVKPNTRYRASFYAKSGNNFKGPLTVSIRSNDGNAVFAKATVRDVTTEWKKYTVDLNIGKVTPSTTNRFVIAAHESGTLWFNQVSLFPPTFKNRPNGTRKDLMQILADMKPTFLRLPGGNYLEGNTIAERFEWRDTIHDISQRPGHQDPWGYRSDDGFGLLEYLEWCEDLHMEPVLAVFAGYALYGAYVAPGPDLEPYVKDALDEIEYVTGGADTKWGAQRAADGHPAPFKVRYVEIGNEDFFDKSGSYEGRYAQFHDAIKAKYPKLQLIATTNVKSRMPDVIDEHFYRTAQAMAGDAHHYDSYSRSGPKIFVGEWASQDIDKPWEAPDTKGPTPSLNSALGDAAWMTGMERNSDIVIIAAYAPLLVNVNPGARQWAVNLIGYDALKSFGSPSFYAQKMFSTHLGDVVVPAALTGLNPLIYSVNRVSKTGTLYIKVVNMRPIAQPTTIALEGVKTVDPAGTAIVLSSSNPMDMNTLTEPNKVVPETSIFRPEIQLENRSGKNRSGSKFISRPRSAKFEYTFAPYSVTVLTLSVR